MNESPDPVRVAKENGIPSWKLRVLDFLLKFRHKVLFCLIGILFLVVGIVTHQLWPIIVAPFWGVLDNILNAITAAINKRRG